MTWASLLDFVASRADELWLRTGEHLMLTGISTALAVAAGVPIGIFVFRNPWARGVVMGFVGILQTIPSLAMLVFLLAMFQKIGVLPALVALTLYALLPIVRNTLIGLQEISSEVIEAAQGIGMTESQQMWMVRFPLAFPVILAGIRTAAVIGVGIATLSAFIGAGGLGQFINRGLALSNTPLIILGAVPAAILAMVVDFTLAATEWAHRLRPQAKRDTRWRMVQMGTFSLPVLLLILGISPLFFSFQPKAGTNTIRIATKNFTEQFILGELIAQLIERRTNLSVERKFNLGGTMLAHGAIVSGEVDIYPEYTGTGLTAILKWPVMPDRRKVYRIVKDEYRKRYGIIWLQPFGFNNTYAIAVRNADAKRSNWRRISDLAVSAQNLRAGFTSEFMERPDGYPGLRRTYGFEFGKVRDLDPGIMYDAIARKGVDVITAFSTDGRIRAFNLRILEDDKGYFPPYYAAPVIRRETLASHPELRDVLGFLAGKLDNATMQKLNFEVDAKKRQPASVARDFLERTQLKLEMGKATKARLKTPKIKRLPLSR
ncbi:glycine betaine ABC transporter substrate-binding protein [Nitrospinota bacterium]